MATMTSAKIPSKVRVAILDDHQSIIDGYMYRLGNTSQIEVVGVAKFGEDLETILSTTPVDVLLMDVQVPVSSDNGNPYPILHVIPRLLQNHPDLSILIISMVIERPLVNAVMDAGASGYILKDDNRAIENLESIVLSVSTDGIFLSQQAHEQWVRRSAKSSSTLTPRQLEALSLCAAHPEWTRADLARKLGVTASTARNLLSLAFQRLGVTNLPAAVAKARQLGLITPPPFAWH